MGEQFAAVSQGLTRFWEQYGALVILGTGLFAVALIVWALWRFSKTGNKSKVVSTFAAVVVMLWTSEGLLSAAIGPFRIPWQFAVMAFFVFEAMMLSAALRAEEDRKSKGVPGAAGLYVFVIALVSGVTSSFGADVFGLVFLRIVLPPLAVGLWWILLVADRDDDSVEIKEKRAKYRADREATWAISWTTVLVQLGVKKPGRTTTTEAQLEYLRKRMVALADKAETLPAESRRRRRLVRKLRVLTRGADGDLVAQVAERVQRARRAEELMIDGQAVVSSVPVPAGAEEQVERTEQVGGRVEEQTAIPSASRGQVQGANRLPQTSPVRVSSVPERAEVRTNGHTVPELMAPVVPLRPTPEPRTAPDLALVSSDAVSVRTVLDVIDPNDKDGVIIAEHREELAELLATGKLSRYRVEKMCNVYEKQAKRIMARLYAAQYREELARLAAEGPVTREQVMTTCRVPEDLADRIVEHLTGEALTG